VARTNRRAREVERQRRERQEARRVQRAERRRRLALRTGGGLVLAGALTTAIVLIVGSIGSGGTSPTAAGSQSSTSASPSTNPEAVGTPVCHYLGDTGTGKKEPLPPDRKATGTHTATIRMTQGTVKLAFETAAAPCTVNSFLHLAALHFFDNTICHRLTTANIFVLQCGDPTGTGGGGPGYTIPDENLAGATYPAGTVAMANTGSPHTGGSQFFLVYKDTPLPASYTPFAKVTSGLDVLQRIAAAGSDNANGAGDGHPKHTVKILSFTTT
jgi:peptidyl-prolyl cis-trans isomerase B (cyclophilin B)